MKAIGLIGLGNMGMPMAAHLIEAGYDVIGYRRGDASNFEALGGRRADSPRDVADQAKIILSCVPSDSALQAVVSGDQGLAIGDCSDLILVELSTLSDETNSSQASALAEQGGVMLDGAISGLPPMLVARKATFLIGGDEGAYQTVKPILDLMTENLHFMGAFGSAMHTKLCANLLVASHIAAAAEALAFGTKIGLDPIKLLDVLTTSAGASLQLQARGKRMATGDWDKVLGSTSLLSKDVQIIKKAAQDIGCPVPLLESAARLYDKAIIDGYGETDVASVYAAFASAAGLEIPNNYTGDGDV
ncbi:MAG: NAD(P)-dependent oxidoreductase [Pseudomonadota bacterium]